MLKKNLRVHFLFKITKPAQFNGYSEEQRKLHKVKCMAFVVKTQSNHQLSTTYFLNIRTFPWPFHIRFATSHYLLLLFSMGSNSCPLFSLLWLWFLVSLIRIVQHRTFLIIHSSIKVHLHWQFCFCHRKWFFSSYLRSSIRVSKRITQWHL